MLRACSRSLRYWHPEDSPNITVLCQNILQKKADHSRTNSTLEAGELTQAASLGLRGLRTFCIEVQVRGDFEV